MKADEVKTGNGKDLDKVKQDKLTSDEGKREDTLNGGDEEEPGDSGLELIGQTIADRYEILALLGSGGMSKVYKARHVLTKKMVAIKMLHQHLIANAQVLRRFQKEAEAASRLSHPHIITVHDFGPAGNEQWYLVMDYLEGVPLSDVIKTWGKVDIQRCFRIFIQACDALAHAHKQGVLHRDLKPSNIMLIAHDDDPDFVKIVDFGIAKIVDEGEITRQQLTRTGEVFGSPLYMSPEQCLGKATDARADIYSMGCLMYEALTGKPPLVGDNILETMYKQMNEMPAGLDKQLNADVRLIQRIENIIFKAMDKDPAQRQQSFEELQEALTVVQHEESSGLPVVAQMLMTINHLHHRARNTFGRHWKLFLGASTTFSIAAIVMVIFVLPAYGPGQEPPLSDRFMEWKSSKIKTKSPKIRSKMEAIIKSEVDKGFASFGGDEFDVTKKRADAKFEDGERDEALVLYKQARDLAAERHLENSVPMAQVYTGIARIYLDRLQEGDEANTAALAASFATRADVIYESLNLQVERLSPLLEKADAFVAARDSVNAKNAFQGILDLWSYLISRQRDEPVSTQVKRGYMIALMHMCNFASCKEQVKSGKSVRGDEITFTKKDDPTVKIDAIQLNNELMKMISEEGAESEAETNRRNIAVAHNRLGMEYLQEGKEDWPQFWVHLQRLDFRQAERVLKNMMAHNHAAIRNFRLAAKGFENDGNEDSVSAFFNLADAQWASFDFADALQSRSEARKIQRSL